MKSVVVAGSVENEVELLIFDRTGAFNHENDLLLRLPISIVDALELAGDLLAHVAPRVLRYGPER